MDGEAVKGCTDEQLKQMGVSAIGDVLALRHFISRKLNPPEDTAQRKKDLVAAIKKGRSLRVDPITQKKKFYKITLGWKHFNENSKRYCSVRRAGGSRTINVCRTDTLGSIIKTAITLFFPNGKSTLGRLSAFKHDIGNFSSDPIQSDITLEDYIRQHSLTHVRLYLLTRKRTMNDIFDRMFEDESSGDEFEIKTYHSSPSVSNISDEDLPVPFSEDTKRAINWPKTTISHQSTVLPPRNSDLVGSSVERQYLKDEIDKAYQNSLKSDQEKYALKKEKEKEDKRLTDLMETRKNRVPPEPALSEDCVTVTVRHTILGPKVRLFHASSTMCVVYDWIGSLSLQPEHFKLTFHNAFILPEKPITSCVLNMIDTDTAICMSPSGTVSFRGFGVCSRSKFDSLSFQ